MIHEPRVKFSASIDANGDIVPGAAVAGHNASLLDARHHYLLEKSSTNEYEIGVYDGTAASGSRRSGSTFASPTTGLICSLIAPPTALVMSYGDSSTSPDVQSTGGVAAGQNSIIYTSCPESTALGGGAAVSSNSSTRGKSTAIGSFALAQCSDTTAVGAYADAGYNADFGGLPGGVAIGTNSKSTAAGEVALGSHRISSFSLVPVRAPAGVSAGGTFTLQSVGYDDVGTPMLFDIPTNPRYLTPSSSYTYILRVEGTITAMADVAGNYKTWNVDYLVDTTAVRYQTFTVLHQGANNPAITFSAAASGVLSVTAPAIAGLIITGLLRVTKIVY